MNDDKKMKLDIQQEIGGLAKILGSLSVKYTDEPLLKEAEKTFLSLSVHVGKALGIQLQ